MARRQIHSDAISFKIFLYFLLGSYKFYCLFGLDVSVVRDNQDSVIVNLGRNQTGDCSSAIPQSVLYSKSASSLYCVCSKNQYGTYIGTKGCIYDHGTSFGCSTYSGLGPVVALTFGTNAFIGSYLGCRGTPNQVLSAFYRDGDEWKCVKDGETYFSFDNYWLKWNTTDFAGLQRTFKGILLKLNVQCATTKYCLLVKFQGSSSKFPTSSTSSSSCLSLKAGETSTTGATTATSTKPPIVNTIHPASQSKVSTPQKSPPIGGKKTISSTTAIPYLPAQAGPVPFQPNKDKKDKTEKKARKRKKNILLIVAIACLLALVVAVCLAILFCWRQRKKRASSGAGNGSSQPEEPVYHDPNIFHNRSSVHSSSNNNFLLAGQYSVFQKGKQMPTEHEAGPIYHIPNDLHNRETENMLNNPSSPAPMLPPGRPRARTQTDRSSRNLEDIPFAFGGRIIGRSLTQVRQTTSSGNPIGTVTQEVPDLQRDSAIDIPADEDYEPPPDSDDDIIYSDIIDQDYVTPDEPTPVPLNKYASLLLSFPPQRRPSESSMPGSIDPSDDKTGSCTSLLDHGEDAREKGRPIYQSLKEEEDSHCKVEIKDPQQTPAETTNFNADKADGPIYQPLDPKLSAINLSRTDSNISQTRHYTSLGRTSIIIYHPLNINLLQNTDLSSGDPLKKLKKQNSFVKSNSKKSKRRNIGSYLAVPHPIYGVRYAAVGRIQQDVYQPLDIKTVQKLVSSKMSTKRPTRTLERRKPPPRPDEIKESDPTTEQNIDADKTDQLLDPDTFYMPLDPTQLAQLQQDGIDSNQFYMPLNSYDLARLAESGIDPNIFYLALDEAQMAELEQNGIDPASIYMPLDDDSLSELEEEDADADIESVATNGPPQTENTVPPSDGAHFNMTDVMKNALGFNQPHDGLSRKPERDGSTVSKRSFSPSHSIGSMISRFEKLNKGGLSKKSTKSNSFDPNGSSGLNENHRGSVLSFTSTGSGMNSGIFYFTLEDGQPSREGSVRT